MNQVVEKNELYDKAEKARAASRLMAVKTTEEKNAALIAIAEGLLRDTAVILDANAKDIETAKAKGQTAALLDRLLLTKERIQAIANALKSLTLLHDPIGDCLEEWDRPNGIHIRKMRVPLGVVGMVYEARPNVTVDATGLCLKTGNAVYLRGSASALHSNRALVKSIRLTLEKTDLPVDSIQLLEDVSHETADKFFKLNGYLDVLIPRGSKRLIETVLKKATVPVLETGAGNCHLFIDETADPEMAINIAINAKTQRPSVCNAIETIIVHDAWFKKYGRSLIDRLEQAGVDCRIDKKLSGQFLSLAVATDEDWETEYLDKIVAIKAVKTVDEAIDHINHYGSKHSEAIISETPSHVERFFQFVDASTLYHNASTRFTDGEEFGFGAEIGISTQKLHARGPMGLPALTTIKYLVNGTGQIRN